jgi:hypothetical protein
MGLRWFWQNRRGSDESSGRCRFFSLGLLGLVCLGGCEFQRQPSREARGSGGSAGEAASEVEAMLHASAASWNGGDLIGFLDDYWRSEELTFSGATGVTRGWEDVRTRYLESYWAPGAVRDSLRFEGIEVLPLGDGHALALGQYVLFRPEEGGVVTSSGFFSLVLQNMEGEWKILHDHTSATPEGDGPEVGES